MNTYLLYTRSGVAYAVQADFATIAILKATKASGEFISCWFLGAKIPADAIRLP